MKYFIQILLAVLLLTGCASPGKESGFSRTSESLQHDLDLARLHDLITLSGYVEDYKAAVGRYPFEGDSELPNYVTVATEAQQKYTQSKLPFEHKKTSAKEFVTELQSKLGNIEVPFDLQRVPVNKPNFYIYMVVDDVYFLAVHLHNGYSFTNNISKFYNKVEVTNNPDAVRSGVWLRSELIDNPAYKAALQAQAYKPGYTAQLRNKLGGNNAF